MELQPAGPALIEALRSGASLEPPSPPVAEVRPVAAVPHQPDPSRGAGRR